MIDVARLVGEPYRLWCIDCVCVVWIPLYRAL